MRKVWTEEETNTLILMYPHHTAKEISDHFGVTQRSIEQRVSWLKQRYVPLHKTEFFKKTKSGFFGTNANNQNGVMFGGEGFAPWNKGMKGKGVFMVGGNVTSFKKGNAPHNTVPIGTIVKHRGNSGKYTYSKIKVGVNKWELLHRYIWESHHGAIPNGCLVKFKDGDQNNCRIENLYLQNKKVNMQQNSIHNYPTELKSTIMVLSKLTKTIKRNGKTS